MKWQLKLLWIMIVALVGMGIWILSYPFSGDQTSTEAFVDGVLDLREYNFAIDGPASIFGEVGYVPNRILYDDEYLVDFLPERVMVPAYKFLDDETFGGQGYGTYILEIFPPRNQSVLAFEIPDISCAYKMWVNGKLVTSLGRVDSRLTISEPMTMMKRVIVPTTKEKLSVVIQVSNYSHHHTGFQDPLIIGTAEQIMKRQVEGSLREYLIITAALLIGLYHIAIFAMREDETAALYFGMFSIFLALCLSFFGEKSIYNIFPQLAWSTRLQIGFLLSLVTILLLLRYIILLGKARSDTKFEKGLQLLFVLSYLGMALTTGKTLQTTWINIYLSLILVIAFYSFWELVKHLKNKEVGMPLAVFGMFVALVVFTFDLTDIYDEKFSSYGLFIFIFSQALALGFRYSEAFKLNFNLASELRLSARILEQRNSEVETAKNRLEVLNQELDQKVNERTEDIKILLDHSGQAFLSLDEDSRIQPDYSKLTNLYIGDNIRNMDLWNILYEESSETADLMRTAVSRAIHEGSLMRRNSYISLLPEVLQFNNHELAIEYKWIKTDFKEQIMMIMTDVTYEKSLIEQIDIETRDNRSNLKIILNSQEFWMIYDEFEEFLTTKVYKEIDMEPDFLTLRGYISKKLHYFKGSFSIYGLDSVVEEIHRLESILSSITKDSRATIRSLIRTTRVLNLLKNRLNRMAVYEGVDIYAYKDAVLVSKSKMVKISKALKMEFGDQADTFIEDISALNHLPFRKMFESYVDYVSLIGNDIGKKINPLQISGGDFMIDPTPYEGFSRSMVHIFRNMIDHGIEKPEIRFERGKTIAGNIELKISKESRDEIEFIHLEVFDDGGGINQEQLKRTAAKSLNFSEKLIDRMKDEDLYQLIFAPEVSTKVNGDIVSGRGLGMTLVKDQILELGGTIKVNSIEAEGVSYVIELPYRF